MLLLRKYPDLILAALFALVTSLFVPFSPMRMMGSVNWVLLGLLFCLMAIVAGLRQSGALESLFAALFRSGVSERNLGRFFIFACFFASMFITNDVSLIVFVPMALMTLARLKLRALMIPVVVLQTIAANMGSMLTPIGNPQNLFLYAYYHIGLAEFLSITAPVVALSGVLIYGATFLLGKEKVEIESMPERKLPKRRIIFLLLLFILCLLHVLRLLPLTWVMAVVVPCLFLLDRHLFREVDYKLLFLFFFLFIGVGNLDTLPAVRQWAETLLDGHEFWVSLLLSQIISNVPATVMLAPYTDSYQGLLLGVNIGGLGILIASMASLISFRAYSGEMPQKRKKYLGLFTAYNLVLLAVLVGWYVLAGER